MARHGPPSPSRPPWCLCDRLLAGRGRGPAGPWSQPQARLRGEMPPGSRGRLLAAPGASWAGGVPFPVGQRPSLRCFPRGPIRRAADRTVAGLGQSQQELVSKTDAGVCPSLNPGSDAIALAFLSSLGFRANVCRRLRNGGPPVSPRRTVVAGRRPGPGQSVHEGFMVIIFRSNVTAFSPWGPLPRDREVASLPHVLSLHFLLQSYFLNTCSFHALATSRFNGTSETCNIKLVRSRGISVCSTDNLPVTVTDWISKRLQKSRKS